MSLQKDLELTQEMRTDMKQIKRDEWLEHERVCDRLAEELKRYRHSLAVSEVCPYDLSCGDAEKYVNGEVFHCQRFSSVEELTWFFVDEPAAKRPGDFDEDGYIVLTQNSCGSADGACYSSPLPTCRLTAMPDFANPGDDYGCSGFVRIGDRYWDWMSNGKSIWLCPHLVPAAQAQSRVPSLLS